MLTNGANITGYERGLRNERGVLLRVNGVVLPALLTSLKRIYTK